MKKPTYQTPAFHCPGQVDPVSRAVHLSRLAAQYPACRQCAHRSDTADFSPRRARWIAEAQHAAPCPAPFDDEGLSGVLLDELTPAVARRSAIAFGLLLREAYEEPVWPTVVLAGDGRRRSMPLVAAAAEGLRLAGCHVIDLGRATTGFLSFAMHRLLTDGGLSVGNPGHRSHRAGLRFWKNGCPLSPDTDLARLEHFFQTEPGRPTRQYGSLRRDSFEDDYLATLEIHYQAMRPLRVVLDTDCRALVGYAERLSRSSSCRFFHQRSGREPPAAWMARHQADLAATIDGNGEMCQLRNERAELVDGQRLLVLIARHLIKPNQPDKGLNLVAPTVVLEKETSPETEAVLARVGWRTVCAASGRAAMCRTIEAEKASLAGGPSGRFWYGQAEYRSPDALVTLSLVMAILSQSGRPLSAVLDEAA